MNINICNKCNKQLVLIHDETLKTYSPTLHKFCKEPYLNLCCPDKIISLIGYHETDYYYDKKEKCWMEHKYKTSFKKVGFIKNIFLNLYFKYKIKNIKSCKYYLEQEIEELNLHY